MQLSHAECNQCSIASGDLIVHLHLTLRMQLAIPTHYTRVVIIGAHYNSHWHRICRAQVQFNGIQLKPNHTADDKKLLAISHWVNSLRPESLCHDERQQPLSWSFPHRHSRLAGTSRKGARCAWRWLAARRRHKNNLSEPVERRTRRRPSVGSAALGL